MVDNTVSLLYDNTVCIAIQKSDRKVFIILVQSHFLIIMYFISISNFDVTFPIMYSLGVICFTEKIYGII